MGIPFYTKMMAERSNRIQAQTDLINQQAASFRKSIELKDKAMEAVMEMAKPQMSLNQELYGSGGGSVDIFNKNISTSRRLTRIAYWSSPDAQAMLGRFGDLVIGPKLDLQSSPLFDLIDGAPESKDEREKIRNLIEKRYKLWSSSIDSDYEKDLNHYKRSRQDFLTLLLDGEYFDLLRYSNTRKRNPLTVQRIPAENIQKTTSRVADGNTEVNGIEYNRKGAAVAYHIMGANGNSTRVSRFGERNGLVNVIHNKIGGGRRGVGILAGIIEEIKKLADFTALEIQAAVINSMFAVVLETDVMGDPKALVNKDGIGGIGQNLEYPKAANDSNFEAQLQKTNFDTGGFIVDGLGNGQKLKSFDTKRPTANFEQFYKTVLRGLFSAKGMHLGSAQYDMNGSYSAARGELLVFWNRIMTLRFDHGNDYESVIYQSWLWGENARGKLDLVGFDDFETRQAWSNALWIGPSKPDIDPKRSVDAHVIEDEKGYKTSTHITAERGGGDWSENIDRKRVENSTRAEVNKPEIELNNTSYSNSDNKTVSKSITVDEGE